MCREQHRYPVESRHSCGQDDSQHHKNYAHLYISKFSKKNIVQFEIKFVFCFVRYYYASVIQYANVLDDDEKLRPFGQWKRSYGRCDCCRQRPMDGVVDEIRRHLRNV